MGINEVHGERQLYLSRHRYFKHCFVHARTVIGFLIKIYEYLKGLAESSFSEEDHKICMEGNDLLKSLIENSSQDNQKLERKISAESPCKKIKGLLSMAADVINQVQSSVNEQMSGFQRNINQMAQANSSLETKCRTLEQELMTVSEEKVSLAEMLTSERNSLVEELKLEKLTHVQTLDRLHAAHVHAAILEVELTALRKKQVQCSKCQLVAVEASRLTQKRSVDVMLAEQVESDAELETAEVRVKQLLEGRRVLSEQITATEERYKLLYEARQENVRMQQALVAEQLAAFHNLVFPTSCSGPMTSFWRGRNSQDLLCSQSDFSNEQNLLRSQSDFSNEQSDLTRSQSDFSNDQSDLLRSQSDFSNEQSDLLRSQSDFRNEQSDLLRSQSDYSNEQSDLLRNQSDFSNQQNLLHSQSDISNEQRDLLRSQSDFSNEQSDLLEESHVHCCNTESEIESDLKKLRKGLKLMDKTEGETERNILSQMDMLRQASSSTDLPCLSMCIGPRPGVATTEQGSDIAEWTTHQCPEDHGYAVLIRKNEDKVEQSLQASSRPTQDVQTADVLPPAGDNITQDIQSWCWRKLRSVLSSVTKLLPAKIANLSSEKNTVE